jgi:hypothetical protein
MFIFNLNVVFTTHVLKVAPIRVRFSPGFPPGGGFHGEDFAPAWFETMTQRKQPASNHYDDVDELYNRSQRV